MNLVQFEQCDGFVERLVSFLLGDVSSDSLCQARRKWNNLHSIALVCLSSRWMLWGSGVETLACVFGWSHTFCVYVPGLQQREVELEVMENCIPEKFCCRVGPRQKQMLERTDLAILVKVSRDREGNSCSVYLYSGWLKPSTNL